MRNQFSTFEVMKALKIPRERLREWMVRGFVVPSVVAKGKGTRAVFTRSDVYAVALFKKLLETGFHRKWAATYLAAFQGRLRRGLVPHDFESKPVDPPAFIVVSIYRGRPFFNHLRDDNWKIGLPKGFAELEDKKGSERETRQDTGDPVYLMGRKEKEKAFLELGYKIVDGGARYDPDPQPEEIRVFNFKLLREEVDAALEPLEPPARTQSSDPLALVRG